MRNRVSLAGDEYLFRGIDDRPQIRGTGRPFHYTATSWPRGPRIDATGMIKIDQIVALPATNINTLTDWTDGSYTASLTIPNAAGGPWVLPAVTRLPLFYYSQALSSNDKIQGVSAFVLYDVQVFTGAFFGASIPAAPTAEVQVSVYADGLDGLVSPALVWQTDPLTLGSGHRRFYGEMYTELGADATSVVPFLGKDLDFQLFTLQVRCHSTSPVDLPAGNLRVVLLGYEI